MRRSLPTSDTFTTIATLVTLLVFAAQASAYTGGTVTNGGSIKGTIKVSGKQDETKEVTKDASFCGATVPAEKFLVAASGGLKNAISLGLFRSQDSVNRRLAEITRQGYKPVVVPKFETFDHYWVRATMAEGFEDISDVPDDLPGELVFEPIDCAGIAGTALRSES